MIAFALFTAAVGELPPTPLLREIALWKRPAASGETIKALTFVEPADCPMIVTLPGSPPKFATLCWTNFSDWIRSSRAKSPESRRGSPVLNAGWANQPKSPSLYATVTTTAFAFFARLPPRSSGSKEAPTTLLPPWM